MPEPKIRLQKYFPSVLLIDGQQIATRVTRMTNAEFDEYATTLTAMGSQKPVDPPLTPAQEAEAEKANRAWIHEALEKYFSVVDGEIVDPDGRAVTSGGDLYALYAQRQDVVSQALGLIYTEHRVSEKKRQQSRLGLVSALGLVEDAASGGNGNRPEPIAGSAEPPSSVDLAAATAPSNGASSGTAAQSA